MFTVKLAPEAYADLDSKYDYIAEAGFPENAYAFTQKVFDFCQHLGLAPHRGKLRSDLRPGLRVLGLRGQATICFSVHDAQRKVTVLRILGRGESIEKAFDIPSE